MDIGKNISSVLVPVIGLDLNASATVTVRTSSHKQKILLKFLDRIESNTT